MNEMLLKDEVYRIMGAAFEVYNELGNGFLESVYQEALKMEFETRHIPFAAQIPLIIKYKGKPLVKEFCADFVCFNSVIVEIKALNKLSGREDAQVINYLKATGFRVALLLNFGASNQLDWQRIVW
jgi:GxxExxY protein